MEEVSSNPNVPIQDFSSNPHDPCDASLNPRDPSTQIPIESTHEGDGDGVKVGLLGRRLTSAVWEHFEQIKVDDEVKARCKGCKRLFVGGGKKGTTHLKDHAKRCFQMKNTLHVRQQLLQGSLSRSSSPTLGIMGKFKFNQEVSRGELCNMIVLHKYPFSMVEHIGFRRYSASLNPDFKLCSRNTIKAQIIREYWDERTKLMKLLAHNESRVAIITTDMWTCDSQKKGYMAITAHYIDNDWLLQSKIIRFFYVPCPHNASTISKALVQCLKSFNLDEKVSTITLDNCTTNDAVMDVLQEKLNSTKLVMGGAYLHMRCCAHILNLIVNDGLKMISGAIEKVRSVVGFITSTPSRYEKFEDACNYCRIPIIKTPALDCKTRWNSCYEMLESALLYKDAFTRLESKVGKGGKNKFQLPSKEEWSVASIICQRLALFSRVTKAFSGTKYPTANLYFDKVCEIKLTLRIWTNCGDKLIESMALQMTEKFEKYWNVINKMLAVATILDPRRKLDCVTVFYKRIYVNDYEDQCNSIRQFLIELVKDYDTNSCERTSHVTPSSILNSNNKRAMEEVETMEVENLWDKHCELESPKKSKRCEVEVYLEEERIKNESKFDLLVWWSAQSIKYPTLSRIARDLLAVPISTVASESSFSAGGRMVGPQRSRLLPDTVEALMCLQSWRRFQFKDPNGKDFDIATIFDDEDVNVDDD